MCRYPNSINWGSLKVSNRSKEGNNRYEEGWSALTDSVNTQRETDLSKFEVSLVCIMNSKSIKATE